MKYFMWKFLFFFSLLWCLTGCAGTQYGGVDVPVDVPVPVPCKVSIKPHPEYVDTRDALTRAVEQPDVTTALLLAGRIQRDKYAAELMASVAGCK